MTVADGAPATTPAAAVAVPALAVDHVSRWYGNVVAVNDISFALGPGVTGLLGPNGAGKSTLLHLMAGLLRPSAGTVQVEGRAAWGRPEMYARIGLVPEREAVHAFLTGYEFALLNAKLQRLPDPVAAAHRAIATVEMTDAADRRISTYSKGMRQRAKLAGALVHDPRILLLDEPFNGMDPRQRLHMMTLLRSMAAEGRTILFSSHILEEVGRLADSILVVYAGRLAAAGDYRSIRRLMTDRPHTFRVRSSDDRRLAAALLGDPTVFGAELDGDRLYVRTSDFGAFTRALAARRARRGDLAARGQPDRRLARERVQLPGPPMTVLSALVDVTVRGMLGRRRSIVMLFLAAIPVLLGVIVSLRGGRVDVDRVLGVLIVQTVLPLIALILGTASLGSEIEDGTVVFLLIKPIKRWVVAFAKVLVAVAATTFLVVPVTIVTGVLISGTDPANLQTTFAFAIACAAGGAAYAAVFVALSSLTARALLAGLVYVLLWEGALGGLLEGTRFLSIRQATLGIVAGLGGGHERDPIQAGVAAVVITVAIVASLAIAAWRLARFEIRGGD